MIAVEDVSKSFRVNGSVLIQALDGASLHVNKGEFVTLIGPSGCGKSTMLNLICGLMEPDSGSISLDGDASAQRLGRVGYMLQRDLLLPWRSLLDNLLLGPEVRGQDMVEARQLALSLLPLFGLEGFADVYPAALSIGMRQRAALLRTILCRQELLLLDEPFGALDALTRRTMRTWLLTVWERFKQTVLFVTHDVDEAIYLADRVYAMSARPGHVVHELTIDLPRPRSDTVIVEPVFNAYRSELLQALGV
ncbi:MAG: ABC transporter ATP-binding protein [Chloroflexi bacterium]|nr:ABC transporter ATP-binding protein [Chloroflexota bacterium]